MKQEKLFWLYRVLTDTEKKNWKRKRYLKIFCIFTTVPFVFIILPMLFRFSQSDGQATISRWLCFAPAAFWLLGAGAYCICSYYDSYNMLKDKLGHCKSNDKEELDLIFNKNVRCNKLSIFIFSLFWIVALSYILLVNEGRMEGYSIYGVNDWLFWVIFVYIMFASHLVSIGMGSVFSTYVLVKEICKSEHVLCDFIEDRDKSLEYIGNFILKTTFLISTGILFIPALIEFMATTHNLNRVAIIIIVFYTLAIVFSFVFPFLQIRKCAQDNKDKVFLEIERDYLLIMQDRQGCKTITTEEFMYDYSIYNYLQYFDKLDIYPNSIQTIVKVVTLALFPALMYLINYIVNQINIVDIMNNGGL